MNAAKQKRNVDGQHRGREDHEKGENRQRDVVTLAAQGEHAYYYAEEGQVDGSGKKAAGNSEVIEGKEDEIQDGQRRRPPLRNNEASPFRQKVAAGHKRGCDHDDGGKVESSGSC